MGREVAPATEFASEIPGKQPKQCELRFAMKQPALEPAQSIWQVVAYHDIFRYPLMAAEIHRFVNCQISRDQLDTVLAEMVSAKQLYLHNGFYCLEEDASMIQRRLDGNARAASLLPMGHRIGRQLGKFPFVRGVGISGSLSKNFADQQADIDFFIITSANRLWIARTLLHGLKKLSFLFGKQHWLCMNYFIDEEVLLMQEQNLFIAMELVTLKPVSGNGLNRFFNANQWALDYFPNQHEIAATGIHPGRAWYKRTIEWMINNKLGDWLDDQLMRITSKRWEKKEREQRLNSKGFPLSLRIAKHYGRPNPEHLQKRILDLYAERMQAMPGPKTLAEIVPMPAHFFRREII
jgi:hypothetical protein